MRPAFLIAIWAILFAPTASAAETLEDIVAGGSASSPVIGLQLVTLEGGKITRSEALGKAQLAPDIPLTRGHKMRVASLSKLVTAIAAMQLVERGLVELDADISSLLGWRLRNPNFPQTAITLRQLLDHTSSIRDGQYYWLKPGHKLKDFFTPGSPHYENGVHFAAGNNKAPGQFFTYSNLNFGIIAAIIETRTERRFDRYVRDHILAPLGMDASFSPCDIPENQLATLYRGKEAQVDGTTLACHYGAPPRVRGQHDQTPPPLVGYRPGDNPTLFSPQGGLRASAEDLARLAMMFIGNGTLDGVQILKPETVRQMLAPSWTYRETPYENGETGGEDEALSGLMTSYGLSIHIADLKAWGLSRTPQELYGHLGDAYGLLGNFWFDPKTGDGLIALITGTETPPAAAANSQSPLMRVETRILTWWLAARAPAR